MPINKLCIVGVGLIGGSLAMALRRVRPEIRVVGAGRNAARLEKAVELGVIDEYCLNPADAVRGADVVVIATPVGSFEDSLAVVASVVEPHTVITDVGSSKGGVVAAVERIAATYGSHIAEQFVPGHPIAGREKSGVEASLATLYDHHRVILTPTEKTSADALAVVTAMWELAGANVTEMGVEHHDEVLAATSHLPHVLAYGLVDTLAQMEERREIFSYAAGGFRDFTRIASSDPVMWRDICLSNRSALLDVLDRFTEELAELRELIAESNGPGLEKRFAFARDSREAAAGKFSAVFKHPDTAK